MKVVFDSYTLGDEIPVGQYLKKKKLAKYFNRETAAAIVSVARLVDGTGLPPGTPFYYAKGIVEYEDFGLRNIVRSCSDDQGKFSQTLFVEKGLSCISPLTQFKILYNMPVCFISIEHGLTGDNAILYASADGLLQHVRYAPQDSGILIGAGKVYSDGRVESGVALIDKNDVRTVPKYTDEIEAIEIFRHLKDVR